MSEAIQVGADKVDDYLTSPRIGQHDTQQIERLAQRLEDGRVEDARHQTSQAADVLGAAHRRQHLASLELTGKHLAGVPGEIPLGSVAVPNGSAINRLKVISQSSI